MSKIVNAKSLTSTIRHFKSSAVTGLLVASLSTTLGVFTKAGFKLGFNLPTAIVLGVAIAIAVLTVAGGILLKKRPDLASEVAFAEKEAFSALNKVATTQIAASQNQSGVSASVVESLVKEATTPSAEPVMTPTVTPTA